MPEDEKRRAVLTEQVSQLIHKREDGIVRPAAERQQFIDLYNLISEVVELTLAFQQGKPIKQGRPVSHEEISRKQRELWVLSASIQDASAKIKMVEYLKQLYPNLNNIQLELK